ncbi:MAG: hypothetical protein NC037_05540, partial [Bacteroides sp.]|nr:hypothetical protein [Bacteroides sp.]
MRESKTWKKKGAIKVMALVAVAMCFALAFSLTLAFAPNTNNGDFANNGLDNVASAENNDGNYSSGDKGTILGGVPETITGAKGALKYTDFTSTFPGTTTTKTSWTATDNFNEVTPTQTNQVLIKSGGNPKLTGRENQKGKWQVRVEKAVDPYDAQLFLFYELSDFLCQMIDNSNITVKAKFSFKVVENRYTNNVWYKAFGINKMPASSGLETTLRGYTTDATKKETSNTTYTASDATLSTGNKFLGICIGMDWPKKSTLGVGYDRYIYIESISLTFTLSLSNAADSASTSIKDGGHPVKMSTVFGEDKTTHELTGNATDVDAKKACELYTPYRPTPNSNWPVYYQILQSDLEKAADKGNPSAGWTLNSYTSEELTKTIGKDSVSTKYYKSAEIDFADTYNYSAGTASSGAFNTSTYTSTADVRKYMGIGGYTYDATNGWSADTDVKTATKVASGIKSIAVSGTIGSDTVSATTQYMYDTKITASNTNSVDSTNMCDRVEIKGKVNGVANTVVGYLVVAKFNRARVRVYLYALQNVELKITVKDYGNGTCESNVTFSGIDLSEVKGDTTLEALAGDYSYVATTTTALQRTDTKWYKQKKFSATVTVPEADDDAPYVWFYTVKRADTISGLTNSRYTKYSSIKSQSTMLPLGYGSFSKFEYDFETGKAKGYKSTDYNVSSPQGVSATGAGYYRFDFYMIDASGRFNSTSSTYYVKVDYDDCSDYSVNATVKTTDNTETISQENIFQTKDTDGVWAMGDTTLTFTVSAINFSGNTIKFTDKNEKVYILCFDREGNLKLYTQSDQGNGLIGTNKDDETGQITLSDVVTELDITDVYFTYSVEYYAAAKNYVGTIVVTFEGNESGAFPTVAWRTAFDISTVAYASVADMEGDPSLKKAASKGKASIFIDRIDPDTPTLSDGSDGYLAANSNEETHTLLYKFDAANKKWKTDNYALSATLSSFYDSVVANSSFNTKMGVFIAVKYLNTVEAFEKFGTVFDMEKAYKGLAIDKSEEYINSILSSTNLDTLKIYTLDELTESSVDLNVEFKQSLGAGMRVIYVWSVDQSGRVSKLNSYYVLIDVTEYTVSASMLDAVIGDNNFGKNGTLSADIDAAKRGDTVTLTFAPNSGYAPFRFNVGETNLLYNYTSGNTFTIADDSFASLITVTHDENSNEYTITYKLDDNDKFDMLPVDANGSKNNVNFTASVRKIVSKTPSANKFYDATKLNMLNYVDLSDEAAKEYLKFEFYSSFDNASQSGVKFDGIPIDVGTYYIRIYLDDIYTDENNKQYNEAFVLAPSETDNKLGFNVPIQFSILQGLVVITPVATESVYGDEIELKFEISGFVGELNADGKYEAPLTGEYLDGSLKLDAAYWGNSLEIDAAIYEIIQERLFIVRHEDQSVSENYAVEFKEGIKHTVKQRTVNVSAVDQSKQFGNSDPAIYFSVSTEQFGWFTAVGGTGSIENLIKKEVLLNGYDFIEQKDKLLIFSSGGRITRAAGEAVGSYTYDASSAITTNNNNYEIVLSVEGKTFTIQKRQVSIDASGQFLVKLNSEYDPDNAPDTSGITLDYALESKDVTFADAIKTAVAGLLMLSGDGVWSTGYDGYFGGYAYDIVLGNNNVVETNEMIITLAEGAIYYIYIGNPDAVIINIRDGVSLDFLYGQIQGKELTYKYLHDNGYLVESTELPTMPDFTDVSWTVNLADGYLGAGSYNVVVSDAKLLNGNEELENRVVVGTFTIRVNPVEIVIRPTNRDDSKIYGNSDSGFNFDYVIVSINGKDFPIGESYAGISRTDIRSTISGAYVRGRYANNGAFRAFGEQYDPATYNNGFIIGGNGDYYSFAVGSAFTSSNSGFTVRALLDTAKKFVIEQKAVNLRVQNFVGVNRAFDNTNTVDFGATLAYNLSSELVRAIDDLRLAFDAVYTGVGSMSEPTNVGIIFTNLRLEGSSANNYRLGTIVNDSNLPSDDPQNELWNGDTLITDSTKLDFNSQNVNVKVVIYYLNNKPYEKSARITISMGAIAIYKSDFSVSKVYDGGTGIYAQNIQIKNRSDANGGSTMLYRLWGTSASHLISGTTFPKADVNSYYVEITLFFDFPGIKEEGSIEIKDTDAYYDETIQITIIENEGVRINIKDLAASITQKILGADDFVSIKPVAQDYTSKADVKRTEITLAHGALADEDVNIVSVNIFTKINDGNVNAGIDHSVEITDESYVSSDNYKLDLEALNAYYSGDNALKVTVNKAKLIPNVVFKDREYNGKAKVEPSRGHEYTYEFIAENYTFDLMDELEKITNEGDIEYFLSKDGVENANVLIDENNGNLIKRDVIVRGVKLLAEGVDLGNYVMYSMTVDGSYVTVEIGEENKVNDYELFDVLTISRKEVKVLDNNIVIKDKVYDGYNTADVKITLKNSGIIEDDGQEQAKYLSIKAIGTFNGSNVGTNLRVTIDKFELVAEVGHEHLLNNYFLSATERTRIANILPRPIGFTVDLGEKEYNGKALIEGASNNVKFELKTETMIGMDSRGGYDVVVYDKTAYYIDKNVAIDGEQVVGKEGTVFNPELGTYTSSRIVNYVLAITTDKYIAPDDNGKYKDADGNYLGLGDYLAYVDFEGVLHYGEVPPQDDEGNYYNVDYCYYALPTADKYIAINDNNKVAIANAFAAGAVAGRYALEDVGEVYAIYSAYDGYDDSDAEVIKSLPAAMTYVNGYGKINQKGLSISSDAIDVINEDAFTKMYDGTTYFYGVEDVDYSYIEGGVVGVIPGDDVSVVRVVAKYENSSTYANYVEFTPGGIGPADENNETSKDYLNYSIDDNITPARHKGEIIRRPIDAILNDGNVEYGTALNKIVGDVTYLAHGNNTSEANSDGLYLLTEWEGQLYLALEQFEDMMGFKFADYKKDFAASMYVIVKDGETLNGFNKYDGEVNQNDLDKYYIRLSVSSLPTVNVTFENPVPKAGESSLTYNLAVTAIDNFVFQPKYSETNTEGNSVLTVAQKDLYVTTTGTLTIGKNYSKTYGDIDPTVELFYLNKDGGEGFAAGENAHNTFVGVLPEVRWGVLNLTTGEWIMLGAENADEIVDLNTYQSAYKYALISKGDGINVGLGDDEIYAARVFAPENADYASSNYNVILGTGFEVADGNVMTTYAVAGDESGAMYPFKSAASTLEIKLPDMAGLTLRGAENNAFNFTYDGSNQVKNLILGALAAGDEIGLGNADEAVEVINASDSAYVGHVVVRRAIKIDEGDPRGYCNLWISGDEVSIFVARANAQLSAVTTSKYYDGKPYAYEVGGEGVNKMISSVCDLSANHVNISYAVLRGKDYEAVDEMRNAGTYRVTIELNSSFADDYPNYATDTVAVTYKILTATVDVIISNVGYTEVPNTSVKTLTAEYDSAKTSYEIAYDIINMSGLDAALQLPKSQTVLSFDKEITSAGRYPFSIKIVKGDLDENNYKLVGAQGVLVLTTKNVEASDASINVGSNIVANRLVAKEITQDKGSGTDLGLW